jgi:predicted nucleic acid-binding protein
MMFTLDASVFVRDLNPREPNHALCRELLERIATQHIPMIEPTMLGVEIAGTLSRELRDPMRGRLAITMLQELPNLTLIALDDALAEVAATIAADRTLRGADAVYVAVAQRYGTTLVSLDREQRERAAPLVTVMTPQEALAALTRS